MSNHKLLKSAAFASLLLAGSVQAKPENPGNACNTPAAQHSNGISCSSQAEAVPELDASSALLAFGIIAGLVTLVRERKRLR